MRTRIALATLIAAGSFFAITFAGCARDGARGPTAGHAAMPVGTADESLGRLMEGNRRFVEGHRTAAAGDLQRRTEVAGGQHPIAVVVCCADSRVGPEIVFDQGLGDIFVVRSAGQVIGDAGYGSIEYAVEHLHAPLIVVVGHEKCGAVSAALEGGEPYGHIGALVRGIRPAVEKSHGQPGDALDNAVRQNVRDQVARLRTNKPVLGELVAQGKLKVVGARYDLDTGVVELLPD